MSRHANRSGEKATVASMSCAIEVSRSSDWALRVIRLTARPADSANHCSTSTSESPTRTCVSDLAISAPRPSMRNGGSISVRLATCSGNSSP